MSMKAHDDGANRATGATLPSSESTTLSGAAELTAGARVAEFKIVRLIGRGGMGAVYLARDTKLGRKVALKVILPERLGHQDAVARFLFEARATASFSHPNIVGVYSVGELDGAPYVALEYVEGETLRQRLRAERPGVKESLRIALAIAEALTEAHRQRLLHRDLKPENVVLAKDGRVRVLDFGIAKMLDEPQPHSAKDGAPPRIPSTASSDAGDQLAFDTSGTGLRGSPAYMAPEQWKGTTREATDVWALGMLLYELLAGKRPYAENLPLHQLALRVCSNEPVPPLAHDPPLPDELVSLVSRCLAKSAHERPPAREIASTLGRLLAEGGRPKTTSSEEQNPFRGLSAFSERHADFFFGRDAEIAAFLEQLRERAVLPIVGHSGVGKSSFVQAGVVPRLREQARWTVIGIRPGHNAFRALASRLRRVDTTGNTQRTSSGGARRSGDAEDAPSGRSPEGGEDELARQLRAAPSLLGQKLRELAESERTRVLLFVDQLEEAYTLSPDEETRRAFLETIACAADDPEEPVRVVMTLREDFLGRVAAGPAMREALRHLTILQSPEPRALDEILRRPLEIAEYAYDDPKIVGEMIASVRGEAASLPLLQFAASVLWERRDRDKRKLLRATYEEMGGVVGALAKHADSVLTELTPEHLALAREILVRLVTPEGTRRVLPIARALAGLASGADEVLQRLVMARLVSARRARGEAGEGSVEIIHEALIGAWGQLARWLEEGREDRVLLGEIGQAADLWEKRGAKDDDAWHGKALADAARAAARSPNPLDDRGARFLAAGARKQARALRRRRAALAVAIGVPLLAAAGSTFAAVLIAQQKQDATDARKQAEHERVVAEGRRAGAELESASDALDRGDLYEARALVRSALETADVPAARVLWWRMRGDPRAWSKDVGASVFGMAYAPDGKTLFLARGDGMLELMDATTLTGPSLRAGDAPLASVSVSKDGATAATWSIDGSVRVWDVASRTARLLGANARPPFPVAPLALSPDGRTIAVPHGDAVELWAASGELATTLHGHTAPVQAVAYSPDGAWLASASLDGTVRLSRAAAPDDVRVLRVPGGGVRAIAWSFDGARIATSALDTAVRVWRVADLGQERALVGHVGAPMFLAFSPDGRHVASGSGDRTARLWDLATGESRILDGSGRTHAYPIVFSPDGATVVVSAPYERDLHAERVVAPPPVDREAIGSAGGVGGLAFDPHGERLVSASTDGALRLWDVARGDARVIYRGPKRLWSVAFSPTRPVLAFGAGDGTVRLRDFDRDPNGGADRIVGGGNGEVRYVAWSGDGRELVTIGVDGRAATWDAESGALLHAFADPDPRAPGGAALTRDGRELAMAPDDGTVRFVDARTGARTRDPIALPLTTSTQIVLSKDDARLGTSGVEGVSVIDLRTKTGRVLDTASNRWTDFDPSGTHLGGSCNEGRARIWDVVTGQALPLVGHQRGNDTNWMTFSRDGTRVATGSDDWTVRVWDARTGRPVWRAPFLRRAEPVLFSQRGWTNLDGGDAGVPPPNARWRAAIEDEAREADESADGARVCIRTHDDRVEMWSTATDTRAFDVALPGVTRVVATTSGCGALAGATAYLVGAAGAVPIDEPNVTAIGDDAGTLLVAGERGASAHATPNAATLRESADPGASAIARIAGGLAVGYREGSVELTAAGGGAKVTLAPDRVPATPVERIADGPPGTIVVGWASGIAALVDRASGDTLWQTRVHGAVRHLVVHGGVLYVASELGDAEVLDLRPLYAPYCDLLREVWREVPAAWRAGRATPAPPPRDHACSK